MSESSTAELDINDAKAIIETIAEMANLAGELASFASYAEIIGALHYNRVPVRNLSDQIFKLNHRLEEELKSIDRLDWMSFDHVAQAVEVLSKIKGLGGLSLPAADPSKPVSSATPSCSGERGYS